MTTFEDMEAFMEKHDLHCSWSVWDEDETAEEEWTYAESFDDIHPDGIAGMRLCYDGGWGEACEVVVMGPTWGDLYIAADRAVHKSKDLHHTFIEILTVDKESRTISMWCGS